MVAREDDGNRTASAGASVIVLKRDAVLMVERAHPPFQGLWSFPGGGSEPDEDAQQTARRELFEETGLDVGPLVRLGEAQPVPNVSEFRLTVFAARAGESAPKAGDDAARAEFVPFSAVLARPTTAGAAGWVARAIAALSDPPLA